MIPVIDMHCDTIWQLYEKRQRGETVSLRCNSLHLDLLRMKEAGYMCQSFALFTHMSEVRKAGIDPYDYAKALSDTLDGELRANADLIRPALSASDIRRNYREGFLSALKAVEEGGIYKGNPELIREFYRMGVRKSTLTWNFENELAWPNRLLSGDGIAHSSFEPATEHGLTEAGRQAVLLMEELGMLIDVSHLGDAGICQVLETVRPDTPVIASHSNARSVTGNCRNLTDPMLRGIAEHGGLAGIAFAADFLSDTQTEVSRISDIITHIRYMVNTAGIDAVGIGTDFDGIACRLELNGAGAMQTLADALSGAGFTTGEIEKIFYANALRVYTQVLG